MSMNKEYKNERKKECATEDKYMTEGIKNQKDNKRDNLTEKYSEIIGLPVICIPDRKVLGNIKNLNFCSEAKIIKGFVVEDRGIIRKRWIIPIESIEEIRKDAILLKCMPLINTGKKKKEREEEKRFNDGEIKGMQVYSKSGKELGVIKDILFNGRNGKIEGVEVSEDIYKDLREGRKIIPLLGECEFGEDMLLVDEDAVKKTRATGGGIMNKFFN